MAGSYMDAPSPRLSYDRDGSVGVYITSSGVLTQLSDSSMRALNNESEDTPASAAFTYLALVFPTPVDITHVFIAAASATLMSIQTSKDTTSGADGTWTEQVASGPSYLRDVRPYYRMLAHLTQIPPGVASVGIRGVRIRLGTNTSLGVRAFHVYARPSSVSLDRLAFWDNPTNSEVGAAYFDWGNTPRASSADKTFRIKNTSAELTARGINIYTEALTGGVPSVAGMFLYSTDSVLFQATVSIPDLGPGEVSAPIYVRRTVPADAQVSVWTARILADVTEWEN